MDFASVDSLRIWLETHILSSPEMAGFGFAMAVGLAVTLLALCLGAVFGVIRRMRLNWIARTQQKSSIPGYRILIAAPSRWGGRRVGKRLVSGLEAHLGTYSFDAPFLLVPMAKLKGGQDEPIVERARKRMALANADMAIWAERTGSGPNGLIVHSLSRGGGLKPEDAAQHRMTLPGKAGQWDAAVQSAAAYFIGRQLQPALRRAKSFRPEKLSEIAAALSEIIDADSALAPDVVRELETQYCAIAVHVSEQVAESETSKSDLEKVILLRKRYLETADAAAFPDHVLQAKLDLGRALLRKAEFEFDKSVLEEAISLLAETVEVLRLDPAIERAQAASDAMFKAQTMLENRKRFSINF